MTESLTDFAVAAWREEGVWRVDRLPDTAGENLDQLVGALRAQPADAGTLGLVSIAEEFFIALRVYGKDVKYLLSDVLAATEFPVASEILLRLDLPMPDEDDESQPAGDLDLFTDLGVGAMEMRVICDDVEIFPDEQLAELTVRLGFGEQFVELLDSMVS
jgi:putative tRNA adenosine deaminase-associated protein